MSTIDSGHLGAIYGGQEGSEEAVLVERREAVYLRSGAGFERFGGAGCPPVFDECQPDSQVAA